MGIDEPRWDWRLPVVRVGESEVNLEPFADKCYVLFSLKSDLL